MTAPNLATEEGRAAYRAELKRVAWPLRLGGLVLIVGAAALILAAREGWIGALELATNAGYVMLGLGWALFIAAIFVRTRYHKRRMAEAQ
jgi:hypothetical protein